MKKRRSKGNGDRQVYSIIAGINFCVLILFAIILFPVPSVEADSVVSAAPKRLKGQVVKINLGIPTRIVVDSVGIDLPVRMGAYDQATQTWTLDTSSAFYAANSVPANDSNGSTLIYGHAQHGLFAKVPDISEASTAHVYTDSGKVFSYLFASARQVNPDDTSIFENTGPPMLTLLTCSGPFDIYRTLVSFRYTGVSL